MGRLKKLLDAARNNPSDITFSDFETMLQQCGWRMDRQTGSHRVWISPGGTRLPIQPKKSKAKAYQVRQFLRILEIESHE